MAKRISAKIEEYTDKEGAKKGKYVDIGVIMQNANGEYMMLNPSVDLAGVLLMQNVLAVNSGKEARANVMCSIFDNDNQSSAPAQRQQQQQQAPSQGGSGGGDDGFSDIPFGPVDFRVY
jgi:hypothetical protein